MLTRRLHVRLQMELVLRLHHLHPDLFVAPVVELLQRVQDLVRCKGLGRFRAKALEHLVGMVMVVMMFVLMLVMVIMMMVMDQNNMRLAILFLTEIVRIVFQRISIAIIN